MDKSPAELMATEKLSKPGPGRPVKPVARRMFICRCRGIRESLGLSLRDVAGAFGLSRQRMHQIESGAYGPSAETAQRLSKFYGKTVNELWQPLEASE